MKGSLVLQLNHLVSNTKLMVLAYRISECPTYCLDPKCFKKPVLRYLWDSAVKSAFSSVLNRRLGVDCKDVCTVRNVFNIDNCTKLVAVCYLHTTSAHEPPPHALLVIHTWRYIPLPYPTTTSVSCLRVRFSLVPQQQQWNERLQCLCSPLLGCSWKIFSTVH